MKKVYNVIGSNNFWFGMCDSLEEAYEVAHNAIKNPHQYGDEAGYNPDKPERIYIYESTEVRRFSSDNKDDMQELKKLAV